MGGPSGMFTVVGGIWRRRIGSGGGLAEDKAFYELDTCPGFLLYPPGDEADSPPWWEKTLAAHSTLFISPLEPGDGRD